MELSTGAIVELDTAVIKGARQSRAARERLADRVGELALLIRPRFVRSHFWNASASGRPLAKLIGLGGSSLKRYPLPTRDS